MASSTLTPEEVSRRYRALYTGAVSDVLDRLGLRNQALPHYIMPLTLDMVVAGPAFTGQGYPVALSEAHEKAVVTAADRENFWLLVEQSLWGEALTLSASAKSRSKRTRWV